MIERDVMDIPHKAWVLVADGERFVVFENHGDADLLDLRTVGAEAISNPPDRLQGSDRPGRLSDNGVNQKSSVAETDWHVIEKVHFAERAAGLLKDWALRKRFDDLVVIADPRTLGTLRKHYHAAVSNKVRAEIDKDFTHLPVNEIETALARH